MRFEPSDGTPEQVEMMAALDSLVQHLVHQDALGRQAAADNNIEAGTTVAMTVGATLSELTWGQIPTVIMHLAGHVGMARMDSGRLAETCNTAADGLTRVAQIMSEADAPVDICAQLMDLAVELRSSADQSLFELSGCNDEGSECSHE